MVTVLHGCNQGNTKGITSTISNTRLETSKKEIFLDVFPRDQLMLFKISRETALLEYLPSIYKNQGTLLEWNFITQRDSFRMSAQQT
jgi:hypothetical protein